MPSQAAKSQQKKKANVWKCSICTYDNEDELSYCDICGVIRNANFGINDKGKGDDHLFSLRISFTKIIYNFL